MRSAWYAISLVLQQGYSRAEAARSLGINANMLGRWIKECEAVDFLSGIAASAGLNGVVDWAAMILGLALPGVVEQQEVR